jgi:hypothetical protein
MTGDLPAESGGGRLRRMLGRLTATRDELEAAELQQGAAQAGGTPIGRCVDRQQVDISGTLRTVTLRPRAGVPALEAELYDGSGAVSIVWLGRRQILGVQPGRGISVHGRITWNEGRPMIFNPRYELHPLSGSA